VKNQNKFFLLSLSLLFDLFAQNPLIRTYYLFNQEFFLAIDILFNTGATRFAFIDYRFAYAVCDRLRISIIKLFKLKYLKGFDKRATEPIIYIVYPNLKVNGHKKLITPILITYLG